ncbi:hypothetical protein (PHISPHISTT) [Plasmodium ovale curtisi]|uniref:Plasmodium RESA N-terminal domain-containing protein n=1 Tax=Plasmodium ovale curtisi TaxID=864141 RepID=A0A1A8XCU2_PLAOA|nr:hypothetical protein (PHISPHISTT) [Plasmodium ovale curtisi]
MNIYKRNFINYFFPINFIHIPVFQNTKVSQLQLSYIYSRKISEIFTNDDEILDSNNSKKNSDDFVLASTSKITTSLEANAEIITKKKSKFHKKKDEIDEPKKKEKKCGICDLSEKLFENENRTVDDDINEQISSLKYKPSRRDILNIWWQVCENERNKFVDLISYFYNLYDDIKYKYKVKKEGFRKNLWFYYEDATKRVLPRKDNYYNQRLLNYIYERRPITKKECIKFVEQYRCDMKEIREDLFEMCQIEVAQVMMKISWWKIE